MVLWVGVLVSHEVNATFIEQAAAPKIASQWVGKLADLCEVAQGTQHYIEQHADDDFAVHAGNVFSPKITLARVKQTLQFICKIQEQDRQQAVKRLHQPDFIYQHFEFVQWLPDKAKAESIAKKSKQLGKQQLLTNIPENKILLTKYYTKLLTASDKPTAEYSQALYALPYDEQGLTQQEAEQQRDKLTRFRYTRQQVMSGVLLQKNLAKPLVWVSPDALHDVLLQGTGVLNVNGVIRYFNVHRNNGIAYDYHHTKQAQARYWYFAEVPSILGYGKNLASKIAIKPQVTVAGNIQQLGLGKLLLLQYNLNQQSVNQWVVLADQGGAFDNNLFQLDLLVGSYRGWQDYHQANKHLPDYVKAWILLLK